MNKLFSFLMVGMAFTALQVATAEAADTSHQGGAPGSAAAGHMNQAAQGQQHHDATQGSTAQGFAGEQHHDGSKGQQHHDDMGNKGQQHHEGTQGNAAQGFSGEHQDKVGHHDGPQGGHHDGPPIDPRSGQPFTQADEVKFQRFADECEATRGLLSEGSTQELVKEGFTRIQVEKLCKDGPQHAPAPGTAGGMR